MGSGECCWREWFRSDVVTGSVNKSYLILRMVNVSRKLLSAYFSIDDGWEIFFYFTADGAICELDLEGEYSNTLATYCALRVPSISPKVTGKN